MTSSGVPGGDLPDVDYEGGEMSEAGKDWIKDQRAQDKQIAESTVESGVWSDQMMFGARWVGYAQFTGDAKSRKDGPYRLFKFRARLDAWRLARKLRAMP